MMFITSIIIYIYIMPQLIPFYFVNQVIFTFVILIIMIYIFSKNILPRFVRLFLTRIFISKL